MSEHCAVLARFLTRALLAAISLGFAANTVLGRPLDDVLASKVLRVIVYEDDKPFAWTDGDTVRGIDADIGRSIAREMGVKPQIIARLAGESVDDDLRSNIWQGPRTGGAIGDVMMHVPMDKELRARNDLVGISNPYYHEQVVLAAHPDIVGSDEGFAPFKTHKLAVQFATAAHYFIVFADEGAYKKNINPYIKFESAAKAFVDKTNAGLLSRRAQIEGALQDKKLRVRFSTPAMPGTLRHKWNIGTAVKEDSRDLGYEVGKILRKLRASGELQAIFQRYGVSYVAPAVR